MEENQSQDYSQEVRLLFERNGNQIDLYQRKDISNIGKRVYSCLAQADINDSIEDSIKEAVEKAYENKSLDLPIGVMRIVACDIHNIFHPVVYLKSNLEKLV
ncbi:MAG: hypothetical protein WC867_05580 [Candidatus Pacearchaeota archaeon]|jgi:hypothetical protein